MYIYYMKNNNNVMGKYYEKQKEELLKSFCFLGLTIAGIMEFYNAGNSIKDIIYDPFFVGAAVMCVTAFITFLTYKEKKIDYTFPAMFFFIFTKLISQYFHSFHINLDGSLKHAKHN